MAKPTKIIWVQSEKDKMVNEVFRIMEHGDHSLLEAIRLAQIGVIDKTRQRPIITVSTFPWIVSGIALKKRIQSDRLAQAAEEEANKPADILQFATLDLLGELIRRAVVEFSPAIREIVKDEILGQYAGMSCTIQEAVSVAFSNIKFQSAAAAAKPESKKHLKSVLIVGLQPGQISAIRNEGFDDLFNLHFWKDQSPKILRQLSMNCEHIIGMTKWMAHSDDGIIADNCKPGAYIRLSGAMTMLEEQLLELI